MAKTNAQQNSGPVHVKVRLRGIFPLMLDPMTEEILDFICKPKGSQQRNKRVDWSPQEEAESKLIRDPNGRLAIPTQYVYSALIKAGQKVPFEARSRVSTAESTELFSFLAIEGDYLSLFDAQNGAEPTWVVDKRATRAKMPGGRKQANRACRPRFDSWALELVAVYDADLVEEATVKLLFQRAGRVGIGVFRPACKGPFGQFVVDQWEVLDGK